MSYNLLVVDDSALMRQMIKRVIAMSGVEVGAVFEAADGLEAIAVLGREWIDVVFADLHMPRMSGIQLVERMSADNLLVTTPVVIVSSDRSQTQMEQLKAKGIRAYIEKPFKPETFRDVVADVLASHRGGSHAR
jgi:two-component system, chemotaxis family, chemotaxis protein CheY